MALTDIKVRTTKPTDKPFKLTDGQGMHLLVNPNGLKWFTEFDHLNRGDMLTSEQHRCHNEKKKFQRRV